MATFGPSDPSPRTPRVEGPPLIDPYSGKPDGAPPSPGFQALPVVGLGGSAGSIAALGRFFESTGGSTGAAYVVVLHLAPDHHSLLPELLQNASRMTVRAARDGVRMEADHVYVIPPGKYLRTVDGELRLTDPQQSEQGRRVAIDLFFRSLADTHGPQATAIVLSGGDGDGASGLRRIKERGGLTIAQDPLEAEHPSMPRAAIGTGMVDWILRVADMPRHIAAYRAREPRLRLPPEDAPQGGAFAPAADRETRLRDILDFIRARTGRDFSYYKRATVVRRISRRMQVCGVEEPSDYLEVLRTRPGEAAALVAELLISVTHFFRDREAFEALEPRIAELLRERRPDQAFRLWVAACATGEEAYSMAMLLLEQARGLDAPPRLQIFACDLDDDAIRFARAGLYPESIAADVGEERLRNFFTRVPGGYLVRREVRETILFASHDLLKDAPFSRIDVLSCRNLLIYLDREAQARCFEIFNFSLNPGALLFLGSSETVPEGSALFAALDKRHRIYRQCPAPRSGLPAAGGRDDVAAQRVLQQHETMRHATTASPGQGSAMRPPPLAPARLAGSPGDPSPANELHFRLLGRWGPASVVVDANHDIVHLSENANRFLRFPEGELTSNLLRLVQPALRLDLRAALLAAEERGAPVEILDRTVELAGEPQPVVLALRVAPAGELAPRHHLVLFDARPSTSGGGAVASIAPTGDARIIMAQMEQELTRSSARLRATIDQYEMSTQELKASNEELQAMNEELHSAGEELESGREELQSVNEELTTLNTEFKNRVEELSRANSDLHNLMSATQIATVFLDRALRIMRYTPPAAPLFNLIAGDIGRPISDLKQRLDYPELADDAREVLRTLVPLDRETRADGRWLLARVLPYRTVEDHIAGVVITFVDITDRRSFEASLRASEEQFRRAIEDAPIPVIMQAEDGQVLQISKAWTALTGFPPEDIPTFDAWLGRAYGPGSERVRHHMRELFKGEVSVLNAELDVTTRDGAARHWIFSASAPGLLRDGRRFVVGMVSDVTERRHAEARLRESEDRLRRAEDLLDAARTGRGGSGDA